MAVSFNLWLENIFLKWERVAVEPPNMKPTVFMVQTLNITTLSCKNNNAVLNHIHQPATYFPNLAVMHATIHMLCPFIPSDIHLKVATAFFTNVLHQYACMSSLPHYPPPFTRHVSLS